MSDVYRKIGEKIAELRQRENLSQEELARLLGNYTASSISYFENGQRKIKVEEIMKIAEIFDEDPSLFLKEIDISEHLSPEAKKFRAEIQNRSKVDMASVEKDFKDKTGFKRVDSDL